MTIAEARTSCKALPGRLRSALARAPRDMLLVISLLLATSAAFGLGILVGRSQAGQGGVSLSQIPLDAAGPASVAAADTLPASIPAGGQVVVSKNGTKYYAPGCSGASRISAANKVYFASAALAEAAGYTPAASCKGL